MLFTEPEDTGICDYCGAITNTEFELDAGLCTDCLHTRDDEDDDTHCPTCGELLSEFHDCAFCPR